MTVTFSNLGHYGRFGNQLFQIASTIGIATKNAHDFCFPNWGYQNHFVNRLPQRDVPHARRYEEQFYGYVDIGLTPGDWDLHGYFQSWIYFVNCQEIVRYYLHFPKPRHNGVAVHIRRGDYLLKQHLHPILPLDYYTEAMKYFSNENFMIFSDDIEWCKDNIKGPNITYCHTGNEIIDFKIMAGFSKFVIANSSYSWWAAYLSESKKNYSP